MLCISKHDEQESRTFGPLKDRVLLDDFLDARALGVRLDPTDVLTPPEPPSL